MTWKLNMIGFITAVVWPVAIAAAQTPDCNGNGVPDHVDIAGKIYSTDWGADRIQRADLTGTGVEGLVTAGLSNPGGIALDVAAGKMYWTDWGTVMIQRANLDGTAVEDLVIAGLSTPYGIALDPAAGKMYWTDNSAGKIQRADLDGSDIEDLVATGAWTRFIALALPSPDADADGVMDECDGCLNDANKADPGLCGCGVSDADSDGDGTPDCLDQCPDDPAKGAPGICGCGIPDEDSDGDGWLDCLDNCPNVPNPDQADENGDGVGDACAPAPAPLPLSPLPPPTADPIPEAFDDAAPSGDCGTGLCASGAPTLMPFMLFGWGWLKRSGYTRRVQRGARRPWCSGTLTTCGMRHSRPDSSSTF